MIKYLSILSVLLISIVRSQTIIYVNSTDYAGSSDIGEEVELRESKEELLQEAEEAFAKWDVDGNGRVTWNEMKSSVCADECDEFDYPELDMGILKIAYNKFDVDKKGYFTWNDVVATIYTEDCC